MVSHRTRNWPAAFASLALAFSYVALARTAAADAGSCVNLHAAGQRGIKSGTLRQAVKDFMACGSDESCPSAVRNECMELYASTERTLPTVIFSVVDDTGADVASVKVFSGPELLAQTLDGRALPIDPGKHQLRIELPWGETLTQELVIREGEKNRLVSFKAHDPNRPAPAPSTTAGTPTLAQSESMTRAEPPRGLPMGFWVATGVGVAALGTGAVFELLGRTKHSDLADCSPRCPETRREDYDAMKQSYLIGDIALGTGVAALGVATIIYFSSKGRKEAPVTAALRPRFAVVPSATNRGATLHLTGITF